MSNVQKMLGRPPNRQLRDQRRHAILDTALKLFAEHGYDATDTQMLSDSLGVGKGTLYRHFASKQELFAAAVNRSIDRLDECIDQAMASVEDPLDRFEAAIVAYLAFFDGNPGVIELLIQERAIFKDNQRPTYFQRRDANAQHHHHMLQQLVADGRLRDVPAERICEVLGNQMYGTMFTNYFAGRQKTFAQQAKEILDVVFHGILSDAERARRDERLAQSTPTSATISLPSQPCC
jgi:AcrR family transcriptional regulator